MIQRSSLFGNTATYGNYVSHLEKCCFFLRYPTSWLTPVVRQVANGLGKCQNRSFRFPNLIRRPLSVKIIHHEPLTSEFAQAALLWFLLSFRGHLEPYSGFDPIPLMPSATSPRIRGKRRLALGPWKENHF